MVKAYRIFKTKYARNWYDGEGAFLFGGRWNSPGTRLLYAASTLSLAALEMLVHLNNEELLLSYSYASLEFNENSAMQIREFHELPENWNDSPPPIAVQRIGDDWAVSKSSLVLEVPTSIIPGELNFLINVNHLDISKVKLGTPEPFVFDKRFYKK